MRKFDPIDIFFIALISVYFLTLICLVLTFLFMKIRRRKNEVNSLSKEIASDVVVKEERAQEKEKKRKPIFKPKKNDQVSWKKRIVESSLFRQLFMKEVSQAKKLEKTKVMNVEKVKVVPQEQSKKEDMTVKKNTKTVETPLKKKATNVTSSTNRKKSSSSKSSTKNTSKKSNVKKKTTKNTNYNKKNSNRKNVAKKKSNAKKRTKK